MSYRGLKASELIALLQALIEQHGDLGVEIIEDGCRGHDFIRTVRLVTTSDGSFPPLKIFELRS